MAELAVSINEQQYAQVVRTLIAMPGKAHKAMKFVLNNIAGKARTRAKRAVAGELGVRQGLLLETHQFGRKSEKGPPGVAIQLVPATEDKLHAKVEHRGVRIPVAYFNPKETPPRMLPKGRRIHKLFEGRWITIAWARQGVRWRMGRMGSRYERKAFIGRGRKGKASSAAEAASGHVGVFVRKTAAAESTGERKNRLPIVALLGPSIPYVAFKNPALKAALQNELPKDLMARLEKKMRQLWNQEPVNADHDTDS